MKLFVLASAVLLLSLQAVESVEPVQSVEPENSLTNYIMYDTEIKNILESTSSNFGSMNAEVMKLMANLKENITDLRVGYGIAKSEYYQAKYEAKLSEIKGRPELNQACVSYIEDVLKRNRYHQRILSDAIIDALNYWKEEYDKLAKMVSDARVALTILEKDANECGKLFKGEEYGGAAHCAFQAHHAAEGVRFHKQRTLRHPWCVKQELEDLSARTNEALEKLYNGLEDVFRFYKAETIIDDWLNENCSE